jgi:transcription elongation GreA/GreB family factor
MSVPDKRTLLESLVAKLEEEVVRATEVANRTRQDATHPEARAENDKDTRALEQTYLARGQAQRAVDVEEAVRKLRFLELRSFGVDDAIALSALVQLQSDDESDEPGRWYFLVPVGGGVNLVGGQDRVDTLTPEAPLGRALIGRQCGEDVTLRIGGKAKIWVIAAVQ